MATVLRHRIFDVPLKSHCINQPLSVVEEIVTTISLLVSPKGQMEEMNLSPKVRWEKWILWRLAMSGRVHNDIISKFNTHLHVLVHNLFTCQFKRSDEILRQLLMSGREYYITMTSFPFKFNTHLPWTTGRHKMYSNTYVHCVHTCMYQQCHIVCVGLHEVQENKNTYTSLTCLSRLQMLYMCTLVYMYTTKIHVYNSKNTWKSFLVILFLHVVDSETCEVGVGC